jgi:hypothetical protein
MTTNWIVDLVLILVALGSIFVLMKATLQRDGKKVGVWGSVMTMAVAALLWTRFAE